MNTKLFTTIASWGLWYLRAVCRVAAAIFASVLAGCSILSPVPDHALNPATTTTATPKSISSALPQHQTKEPVSTFQLVGLGEKEQAGPKDPTAPPPRKEKPIDLAAALQLAGIDNPTINLARERINEAQGLELSARAMLLPSLTVGGNYHAHFGNLQRPSGTILDVNSSSFYFGLGAGALGASSVASPGFRIFAHLGEAYFEPLIAQQRVANRKALAGAVQNRILFEVSEAYLNLLGLEAQLEVLNKGELELTEIVRLTSAYAKAGQGREGDYQRAKARADLLHREIEQARGELDVASARLSQLLNLDPSLQLHTPGGKIPLIHLINENAEAEALLTLALETRPEISAQKAAILEARSRVREEQTRPFLPTLSIGMSYGEFAGASNLVNENPQAFLGRTDIDVFAVWTLQNLAAGNIALSRRASSLLGQAIDQLNRTRNEVSQEVSEALSQTQAAGRQIELTRRVFVTAEEGYREEMLRIKQGPGLPIETLNSFEQWLGVQQDLVRTIMAYNVSQFRLFVATGATPSPETLSSGSRAFRTGLD